MSRGTEQKKRKIITMENQENKDLKICHCFDVYESKIRKFCRICQPKYVSMISDCFGAGTGCGSCIPDIENIFNEELKKNIDKKC